VNFGGFSLLIVFNPNITSIAGLWPPGTSAVVVGAFEATLVVGVVGGVAAIVYRFYRGPGTPVPEVPWLALLALAAVSGSLLAIVTTQAENVVAVLPLLLLAAPWLGQSWSGLYWWLSLTAFGEYLALLTPLAFFYPLFELLGPGAVQWSNGIVLSYALDETPVAAGVFWIVLGVLGGLALITVWAVSAARTWRLLTSRPADSATPEQAPRAHPWQIPGRTSRSSAPATVAAVVVIALLTLEVGVTSAVAGSPRSVLQVSVLSVVNGFSNVVTTIRLTAGTIALAVHVGILPGTERFPGPIHVFADPSYPEPNGSFTTTEEVAERVALALSGSGDSVPIDTVNGGALPALLAAGPVGTLVVLGGLVPDTVLSNSSTTLAAWVTGGGTLMWAGGPLGWSEGHPTPGGFVSDPLGWQGQLDLVHYPMSDVGRPGPLLSWNASPIAAAFGTTYNGTPAGADTSAVGGNGGVDLGLIGPS
ncbi:MAG: hypothetical protein L3J81_04370, partial [Thermoplasmata archaeon]|nr:hypothetical protein [Thermoplasmata archaeon]